MPKIEIHHESEEPSAGHPRRKSVALSFQHAWDGVQFCFDTQRHMRVHFTLVVLVLLAAWTLGINGTPFLHLLAAAAVVLVAEMINTALEAATELIVEGYDVRVKVIKDVAAGAVLIAAIYALLVAVMVFSSAERVVEVFSNLPEPSSPPELDPLQLSLIGSVLLAILISWLKHATGRGTFWRGGVVSGHSALGFLAAVLIMLVTHDLSIMLMALALAILLLQSRVQARIHTLPEALLGALAGTLVALILFIWQFN